MNVNLEKSAININDKIRKNLLTISPESSQWQSPCKVRIQLSQTGEVLNAAIVESTGNKEKDRLIKLAIRKSSPLPLPKDRNAAKEFRDFTITFGT